MTQRYCQRSEFDFLKPTHKHFNYFTTLVDQYSKIINESYSEKLVKLNLFLDPSKGLTNIIKNAEDRMKWMKYQTESKKFLDDKDKPQQEEDDGIDWHDFILVQTIDLYDDAKLKQKLNYSAE